MDYDYKWNNVDNEIFKADWDKHGNPDKVHWGKPFEGNWAVVKDKAQRAARWVAQKKDEYYQDIIKEKENEIRTLKQYSEDAYKLGQLDSNEKLQKEIQFYKNKRNLHLGGTFDDYMKIDELEEKLEKAIRIIEGTAISDSRKKCNDMSNKFLKEISEKSEGE